MKAPMQLEPCGPWPATHRRKGTGLTAARAVIALVLLASVLLAAWPAHAQRAFDMRPQAQKLGAVVAVTPCFGDGEQHTEHGGLEILS